MEFKKGSWNEKKKEDQPVWAKKASKSIKHDLSGMVAKSSSRTKINFNIARIGTLTRISEIGPVRAAAIRDYRNKQKRNNPSLKKVFTSLEDLKNVPGISTSTVTSIKNSNLQIVF